MRHERSMMRGSEWEGEDVAGCYVSRKLNGVALLWDAHCANALPCWASWRARSLRTRLVPAGSGGEFLEAVIRDGGEGVVAKRLSAPYGDTWWKCKRIETEENIVAELHPRKSSVCLTQHGRDCGWLTINCGSSAVGDVVEVRFHSRHLSGKLREPGFVRSRPDKS